jgi:hypothetical protein
MVFLIYIVNDHILFWLRITRENVPQDSTAFCGGSHSYIDTGGSKNLLELKVQVFMSELIVFL